MIMITAVIKPFRLDHVRSALLKAGIAGLTVTPCAGYGRNPRMVPSFKGGPDVADLIAGIKIETAVDLDQEHAAIDAIVKAAKLGEPGDGKIFVMPLDRVVSIRTGADDDGGLGDVAHRAGAVAASRRDAHQPRLTPSPRPS